MEKEIYKNNAKRKMDDIFSKIRKLESKKSMLDEETRIRYEKSIAELDPQIEKLQKQYQEFEDSTEETLEKVKEEYDYNAKVLEESLSNILF